jgi:CRP-like cAMP-binding protein
MIPTPESRSFHRVTAASVRPQVQNRILSALQSGGYAEIVSTMDSVVLEPGSVILEADEPIRYVVFPDTSVISMQTILEDGDGLELGIIGNEGMVGIGAFFGATTEPERLLVKIGGKARRMPVKDLRAELLGQGRPLHRLLLRYTQTLMQTISQAAACYARHSIEQRLVRWLLTMSDKIQSNELCFTQEDMSLMISSRRPSVTMAARELQSAGMVKYSRGHITLVNRKALEASACECYWVVRHQFEQLHADIASLVPPPRRNVALSPERRHA